MLEMLFANIVEITASVSILILLLLALTPLLRRPVRGEMAILGMVCFGGAAFDSAQYFTAQGARCRCRSRIGQCFPCRRPIQPHRFRRYSLPLGESRCGFLKLRRLRR